MAAPRVRGKKWAFCLTSIRFRWVGSIPELRRDSPPSLANADSDVPRRRRRGGGWGEPRTGTDRPAGVRLGGERAASRSKGGAPGGYGEPGRAALGPDVRAKSWEPENLRGLFR